MDLYLKYFVHSNKTFPTITKGYDTFSVDILYFAKNNKHKSPSGSISIKYRSITPKGQIFSLCKKTPTTAPKKNRDRLLFSFLNQLSRSGFCKVFTLKTNKKHNRDSLDSKISKAPEKNRGRLCIWRFLIKD